MSNLKPILKNHSKQDDNNFNLSGHVNEEAPVTGPSGSRVPQQHPTEPSLPGPSGLGHQQQQRPGSSGASGNGRGSHRKGYLPKKLRMSGDSEASARSSLSALITAASSPSVYPSLQEMSPGEHYKKSNLFYYQSHGLPKVSWI